ncbi:hypothetical protein MTR_2g094427 [Medicago truncatula]|uniref:Uncharacterized protein n=1 Tax=Medicago truncatula TaxID=3880 RepID=A0A072VMH7_MEDTR|nr:hypothetical protein MTR_2g094427 [Medicago truncatula]
MGKKKVGDLCQPTQFHASSLTSMVILRVRLKNSSAFFISFFKVDHGKRYPDKGVYHLVASGA